LDRDPANKLDYEALSGCAELACEPGFAQRIEGGTPFTIHDTLRCIVGAMRDRKPGLYRVTLDHTWGNGSDTAEITVFVSASGEAEVGVHHHLKTFGAGEGDVDENTWDPTERCSLAAPTFFEACLTALPSDDKTAPTDEAWACIYPEEAQKLPWFEGCKAQAPTCK
jgi:hypothetical protein